MKTLQEDTSRCKDTAGGHFKMQRHCRMTLQDAKTLPEDTSRYEDTAGGHFKI